MNMLYDRILDMLAEKGARKVDLAKATGSPRATITDWTSGKTHVLSYDKLMKAAKFLGVNPEWLNTGKGDKYPPHDIQPTVVDIGFMEYAEDYRAAMIKGCYDVIGEGFYDNTEENRMKVFFYAIDIVKQFDKPSIEFIKEGLREKAKNKTPN